MRRRDAVGLSLAVGLAGCGLFQKHPLPPAPAHYTLGDPYQMGGVWYYPVERTEYTATGLAALIPDHAGLTADGERYDAAVLAGSHHTLQLPAIARVTNLENGRSLLVRLNDRGPDNPGRLLGLTPHAAQLLGVQDGTQVAVTLEPAMTQALTDQLGGGPKLAVAAAPRADVQAQDLPPPPGATQAARVRGAPGVSRTAAPDAPAQIVPDRLPDVVDTGPAQPGLIFLQASEFGRFDYAQRLAARLAVMGARVQRLQDGRTTRYRVVAGPFISVAAADDALDRALRAGVIDSRLVINLE